MITAQHQRLLEKNTLFVPIHRIIEINHAIAKDLRLSLREEKKRKLIIKMPKSN